MEEPPSASRVSNKISIYCSGSFDLEEYKSLRIQEQRYNKLSSDAMRRLENLVQESDELIEVMEKFTSSPQSAQCPQELLRRADQVDPQMMAEETTMDSYSRRAAVPHT